MNGEYSTTNWAELGGGRLGYRYEGVACYVRTTAAPSVRPPPPPPPAVGSGVWKPLYRYYQASRYSDHFYLIVLLLFFFPFFFFFAKIKKIQNNLQIRNKKKINHNTKK